MNKPIYSLLLILSLGVFVPKVEAQVGFFIRVNCTEIVTPVTGQSWCAQSSDNTFRYWSGTTWTAVATGASTELLFSGLTTATNTTATMTVGSGASLTASGTGTITANQMTSDAADPADSGKVRLGNAESIAWEASPAGTNVTLNVNSAEQFAFSNQILTAAQGIEFTESDTNPTCAAGNYTIYADLSELQLKKCINGTASNLDTTSSTLTLDQAFDNGKVVDGATSFANALRITDASGDGVAIYRDATNGPVVTCIVATVENDCDKTIKLAVGKVAQWTNNAGTELGKMTQLGVFSLGGSQEFSVNATGNPTKVNNVAVAGIVSLLDRKVTSTEVVNTLTETSVYSFSVLGGTLSTNRALRLTLQGDYLNNSGAAANLTVKVKYGATTICDTQANLIDAGATRRGVQLDVVLSAANATNAQRARCIIQADELDTVSGVLRGTTFYRLGNHNAVAIDSTAAQTLDVTVTHGTAAATISFIQQPVQLEVM